MRNEDRNRLKKGSINYYRISRFYNGICECTASRGKLAAALAYMAVALYTIYKYDKYRERLYLTEFGEIAFYMKYIAFIAFLIFGLLVLIYMFGAPINSWLVNRNVARIGLENKAGETPYLLKKTWKDGTACYALEFLTFGIPIAEWEDKRTELEAALNLHIMSIKQGKNRKRVIVLATDYENSLDNVIAWDDGYISNDDFVLVLGESFIGQEIVNLNKIPHILIGGSTGSGKSILLKNLIWQAMCKGAEVIICDFKGGVDFGQSWSERAEIITKIDGLVDRLESVVAELENRKKLLKKYDVENIVKYNLVAKRKLQRIIFACDEIAEILDKTGLAKEEKEKIYKIENLLATIARQGRAFGINLILSTQRPDANILNGQIRNNIDCRICGRADDVLSKIILDNTDASEIIQKDEQGLFLTNGGVIIRGYFFNG